MSDETVGQLLAQAREARGLTIDDVSSATRVRATLIRAIEVDDFSHCGGDFYARGHIRSIAHVVGIDPEPLVASYDRAHGGAPVPLAPVQPMETTDLSERMVRRRPNWQAAMVVVLVAVCGIAGAEFALSGGGGSDVAKPPLPVTQESSVSPKATPATRATSPAPVPSDAVAAVRHDQVTVLVRVTGDSTWLSAKNAAGVALFEGLLHKGDAKQFVDKTALHLVIGNAPAVQLVVNSHEIGVPPAQGNVSRLTFTPGDFADAAG